MIANPPSNQAERLVALRRYDIVDTPVEEAYDHICKLAALICQTPIAVINFIDEHRQWFKSEIGLGVRETPLGPSICAHAILQEEMLVVPDTLLDERFVDNPLCVSHPFLRFYAGALLRSEDRHALGTLCVLDFVPRTLTEAQTAALRMLSVQVMQLLEMRRTLKALRTSEEFARSFIDSSPDCVKVLDLEGRLLAMNEAGCRLMQVDDLKLLEQTSWFDFWTADMAAAQAAMDAAVAGGHGKFLGCCPTMKGLPRWWDVILTPIRDADGRIVKVLCVSRDITNQRRVEEQLRNTAKLESLGVMAGGIAHDFNNLLTGILGNASLLLDSVEDEDREFAAQIIRASEKAANLTRQMLAYSGQGRLQITLVNLSTQVREILPLIQPSLGNVAVTLRLAEGLPAIKADPVQIQQVVMNLVINAAEAMDGKNGSVVIETYAAEIDGSSVDRDATEEPLHPGPFVCLEVHDTGGGMSEQTQARIFDPFFTTKFTGRGLGLAAVSGIVRGHQGGLRVASQLGQGTTFKVFFPAHVQDGKKGDEARAPVKGTILFVDDEEIVRTIAQNSLQRNGYAVRLATNGREAVESLRLWSDEISLIVLDLTMPVMNGEEAFVRLRAIRPDVPIVISSGYTEVEVVRRFTAVNIAGFIQKPYTAAVLNEKITAILASTQPSKQLSMQ